MTQIPGSLIVQSKTQSTLPAPRLREVPDLYKILILGEK